MVVDKITIPSIQNFDFTNAIASGDFGHMLFSAYRNAGGFITSGAKAKRLLELEEMAQLWVSGVNNVISESSADAIIQYLSWFDIVHRIGFKTPAPEAMCTKWLNRAFSLYNNGERCNYHMLASLIRNHNNFFPSTLNKAALTWQVSEITKWNKEFEKGDLFSSHQLKEGLKVAVVLRQDLTKPGILLSEVPHHQFLTCFNVLTNNIEKETDPELLQYLLTIVSLEEMFVDRKKAIVNQQRIMNRLVELDTTTPFLKIAAKLDLAFNKKVL